MGKAIVVAAIVLAVAVVLVALLVVSQRLIEGPGVRRRELSRVRERLRFAEGAIKDLKDAALLFRDIDSALASAVHQRIEKYENNVKELIR